MNTDVKDCGLYIDERTNMSTHPIVNSTQYFIYSVNHALMLKQYKMSAILSVKGQGWLYYFNRPKKSN